MAFKGLIIVDNQGTDFAQGRVLRDRNITKPLKGFNNTMRHSSCRKPDRLVGDTFGVKTCDGSGSDEDDNAGTYKA
ncbi:hypothetical protein NC652_020515 [Populus alba x Populus x berolinensis]|nr:hypothetical protein NC652_020515 [Populus alba x Populus x berolinensis]